MEAASGSSPRGRASRRRRCRGRSRGSSRAGLVRRVEGPGGDRRRVALELTEEADRVLRLVRSRRTAWLTARLAELDDDRARSDRGRARAPPHAPRRAMTRAFVRLNRRTFASLKYRNYRLFFSGQIVSITGTWMQNVAMAWLVLDLTGSPVAVGDSRALPVPSVQRVRALLRRDHRPARPAPARDRNPGGVDGACLGARRPHACSATSRPGRCTSSQRSAAACSSSTRRPARRSRTRWSGRQSCRTPSRSTRRSSTARAWRGLRPAGSSSRSSARASASRRTPSASSPCSAACSRCACETSCRSTAASRRRSSPVRGRRFATPAGRTRVRLVLLLVLVVSTFAFNFNVLLPVLAKDTLGAGPEVFGILSASFGAGALIGALLSATIARASLRILLAGTAGFGLAELLLAPAQTVAFASVLLLPPVSASRSGRRTPTRRSSSERRTGSADACSVSTSMRSWARSRSADCSPDGLRTPAEPRSPSPWAVR